MIVPPQRLRQIIRDHSFYWLLHKRNDVLHNNLAKEVGLDVNMLRLGVDQLFVASAMQPWVSWLIVVAIPFAQPMSESNKRSHSASCIANFSAMFSASVLYVAIVGFRLDFHETTMTIKSKTYQAFERHESKLLAHDASSNSFSSPFLLLYKRRCSLWLSLGTQARALPHSSAASHAFSNTCSLHPPHA